MKIAKTLEKHKPFSLYTLHLSDGFVATHSVKCYPTGLCIPLSSNFSEKVRDAEKLARLSIPMAMQDPLGLYTPNYVYGIWKEL